MTVEPVGLEMRCPQCRCHYRYIGYGRDVEVCPICGHCAPFGHFIISMEGDKCLTKQEKPSTGRN